MIALPGLPTPLPTPLLTALALLMVLAVVALGAGEILLTSMDGDGTQAGYDLALTRAVADAVEVPVIASGGAGCIDHIAAALDPGPEGGHAAAALLASLLHDGVLTVEQIKLDLLGRGLPIRPLAVGC